MDQQTEKNKVNELYVKKLVRIVLFFSMQQFTCQRIVSEDDNIFI